MNQNFIHQQICRKLNELHSWFGERSQGLAFPIYCSFDIRDSGSKVCPVDANIFPAGFNNICDIDKESSRQLMANYIASHYPDVNSPIILLTEEHTQNAYYWENVYTIKSLLEASGQDVHIAIPRTLSEPIIVKSVNGHEMKVFGANRSEDKILVKGEVPQVVISNNDFSSDYSEWLAGLNLITNPSYKLGWYWRRKDQFFSHYNELIMEFCKIIDVPHEFMTVRTEAHREFDISSDDARKVLADKVDAFIADLKSMYRSHNIEDEPYVFVKNNSGTYGLGVIKVNSGEEIINWSYKSRKKMKAAKGGGGFSEVIVQEGIPTKYKTDEESAEPAIYLIGKELAGGFLRTHSKKGPDDNLNSPGAVYKRLCVSDLKIDSSKCPMENVYGWVAKTGALAIAMEAQNI